ncbi:MAG: hypothetical protein RL106_1808 [Bacteroidota bacterium]
MSQNKWSNISWRKVGIVSAYVGLFALLITLTAFSTQHQNRLKCWNVEVEIKDNGSGFPMMTSEEILALCNEANAGVVGKLSNEISVPEIRRYLMIQPFIRRASVYQTLDGRCQVTVELKRPIAQVLDSSGVMMYIDEEGWTLPMKEGFAADVPVFTGNFRTPILTERISSDERANAYHVDIWNMAKAIAKEPLWDAQVDQMYWAPRVGWVMYPRMGNQVIRFGEAMNFEKKMNNLFVFYSNTLPHIDLEQYDTLDARFVNQIIGVKRNYTTL